VTVQEFRLPDVGEGLLEAEILRWHVAPGDEVKLNMIVVEIETAKSAVELPSPFAGTVVEILAGEGETIEVGSVLLTISSEGVPSSPARVAPALAAAINPTGAVPFSWGTDQRPRRRGGERAARPPDATARRWTRMPQPRPRPACYNRQHWREPSRRCANWLATWALTSTP
jgi:2-oxoisovalerate dehydrogenase E2 component (dihydrolipoyl transacylase)